VAPLPAATTVGPLPSDVQRGICLAHSWEERGARGYGTEVSAATLQELRALGATWVSLTPFGFMASASSDEVHLIRDRFRGGETDERLTAEIRAAHQAGLKVLLKPHLWIRNGTWQATLDPGSPEGWARWFQSYRAFMLHYAVLARTAGADMLSVGVELGSATRRDPQAWRKLIAEVRAEYPGPLVYGANWDEALHVEFWDALDFIGVHFYAPLATHEGAPPEELAAALDRHLDAYQALAERTGRKVLFTEVGYKSIRGTALKPAAWPEELTAEERVPSQEAQALAYRVFLDRVARRPSVAGLYVWKWFTNPDTREEDETGFSPRGKQAEAVLRAAFSAPPLPVRHSR
jgi:hypothetical protein